MIFGESGLQTSDLGLEDVETRHGGGEGEGEVVLAFDADSEAETVAGKVGLSDLKIREGATTMDERSTPVPTPGTRNKSGSRIGVS